MKNIKKLFVCILVSVTFSCNDAIDIDQPGLLLSENAFGSVSDLNDGLIGVYGGFDNTQEILLNAIFTDEITLGLVNGGQNRNSYGLILTSASPTPFTMWTKYYIALANINRLIKGASFLTPESTEVDQYNSILGQAYALRAYAHFQLQTYFSTDYTDDSTTGVIALNFVPEIGQEVARNTNGEVFDFINSDLVLANSLLSDDTSDPTFINKDFVTALRARMALYREDYTLASTLASSLLTNYPLANSSVFPNIWTDDSNGEIIFKLERVENDPYSGQGLAGGGTAGSLFAFGNSTLSGSPFMEMDRNLYNSFDPADVRLSTYIDPSSLIDTDYQNSIDYKNTDVLVIRKYPGSGGINLLNDLKIFRSSEMLFIMAEAEAANNQLGNVATLIKQLRDSRFTTPQPLPTYADQTAAFADILDERRKELALEGHRWVDIKRIGSKAGKTLEREPLDCAEVGVCTMSNTDKRFTMPIPLAELDVNSLLTQNPGY